MGDIPEIIRDLRSRPNNVRFTELVRICDRYLGQPRQQGTSHLVYRTPWPGDPRVNIQDRRGMAKKYQVQQVIRALEKLSEIED